MLLASDFDKSKYLKAPDLDREKKFRIKEVTADELTDRKTGQKETKLIVWFTNDQRGFTLNKINNRTLRGAFGDDTAGWVDKVIVLFPTEVDFGGKMVPALRVRIPPPKKPTATAEPTQPAAPSGNGAAAAPPPPAADPELEPDPKLSAAEEMDDEIPF